MFLPSSTLDDILFPMTADVYYSTTQQQDYGNISKTWVFDRKVNCSVISELSNRGFTGELRTKGSYMPITAIAITNIKDPAGNDVWINGQNLSNAAGAIKTKYEIKTIVPTFDYNHNLRHFRLFISKSQIQKWDQ